MERSIILAPLDGSTVAEAALPYAVALARPLRASIRLIAIVECGPGGPGGHFSRSRRARLGRAAWREKRAYLDRIAGELQRSGVEVRVTVHAGTIAERIVELAERLQASLIVMATHGRGGVERLVLGSVADKVMRSSLRPLLLVPPASDCTPASPLRFERIMVPLDGSPLAEAALPLAGALAGALDARLELVRAEPLFDTGLPGNVLTQQFEQIDEETSASMIDYLRATRRRLPAEIAVEPVALRGRPGDVVAYAEYERVDLVVMTTHGRAGLRRFVLGSIADRMVRSEVPTLLVPPPQAPGDQPVSAADLVATHDS